MLLAFFLSEDTRRPQILGHLHEWLAILSMISYSTPCLDAKSPEN